MYMITLDNFENFVPYKIWMRGEEYYETDAVSELEEISPGEWTATVEGTDDYNVEISMDGNEIESWYCDCPYDGEICKHVVATLLAIRDNRKKAGNSIFSKMKIKAEETPVLEEIKEVGKQPCPSLVDIQQLLSFIDPQELSKFICEYASTNLEFKTALSNHFIAKELSLSSKGKDYRIEIQKVFKGSGYHKRSRYHNRYDNYDRKGPKVFAGEYACHGKGKKWNHFNAALLEAAFMTGLERNADIVHMATYAPLFAHVEGWQWRPDMIWFDNLNSVRTVSYYVQQLYAQNKGTNVLPLTMNKKSVTGAEGQNGLFASAVYDKDKNELIVKVANTSNTAQSISLNFAGLKKQDVLSNGRCIKLRSLDLDKDNTLEQPFAITPQETAVSVEGHVFTTEQEPNTFAVYKFTKK